jgi:hypothetical protein
LYEVAVAVVSRSIGGVWMGVDRVVVAIEGGGRQQLGKCCLIWKCQCGGELGQLLLSVILHPIKQTLLYPPLLFNQCHIVVLLRYVQVIAFFGSAL